MEQQPEKTDTSKVALVWDEFAQKYRTDRRTSTPDAYLVDLEIRTLNRIIREGGTFLDVGCGNGYTSIKLALKKNLKITGVDISIEMIKYANQLLQQHATKLKGAVEFRAGDILAPDFIETLNLGSYDTALTKRTIINVLTWKEQKESISMIWRLLKPQGYLIMIEATTQGYDNMNRLREKFGIPKTPVRWHNKYLDEEKLVPFLKEKFDVIRISNFSSTYYIGSRVIQPILLKPFGKEPSYDSFLNRVFSILPSCGNYGIQKLFICRKKN